MGGGSGGRDEGRGGEGREEGRGGELPGLRGRDVRGTDGRKIKDIRCVGATRVSCVRSKKDHVLLRKFIQLFHSGKI